MKSILLINAFALVPAIATVRLSFPMWYEREELAHSPKTWLVALLLSLGITSILYYSFDIMPPSLQIAYVMISVTELLFAVYLVPMLFIWISKKIDRVFFLASTSSFVALLLLVMPLLAPAMEVEDLRRIFIVSFAVAAFLGTSLSSAVLKEIRRGDFMASLGTFIQILTLTDGLINLLYNYKILTGYAWLSFVLWVVTFAATNFYASRYLRAVSR